MRDIFIFYGTVLSCKVDKLIQLFADIILNGEICELKFFFIFIKFFCYNNIFFFILIGDKDVIQEKNIILHELYQIESNREKVVMDYLPSIAYQDTALGNSVYPETDIIK